MSEQPLQERACRFCGTPGPHFVKVMTEGKHYARVTCAECSAFIGWLPKPDNEKARRPATHRDLVAKFGRGYCEMCLTPESKLPKGESLEGHHVDEYQNGGEASRENTWILCTACHSLVNWRRTYQRHILEMADKMVEWKENERTL